MCKGLGDGSLTPSQFWVPHRYRASERRSPSSAMSLRTRDGAAGRHQYGHPRPSAPLPRMVFEMPIRDFRLVRIC